MLKKAALIWGIVFVLVGILGFVPGISQTDSMGMRMLLGIFMVNWFHNLVHLATGLVALASAGSERAARLYFQIFGIVYGLVTIIGFIVGSGHYVLGIIPVNTADNFLHLIITIVTLALGFAYRSHRSPAATLS